MKAKLLKDPPFHTPPASDTVDEIIKKMWGPIGGVGVLNNATTYRGLKCSGILFFHHGCVWIYSYTHTHTVCLFFFFYFAFCFSTKRWTCTLTTSQSNHKTTPIRSQIQVVFVIKENSHSHSPELNKWQGPRILIIKKKVTMQSLRFWYSFPKSQDTIKQRRFLLWQRLLRAV